MQPQCGSCCYPLGFAYLTPWRIMQRGRELELWRLSKGQFVPSATGAPLGCCRKQVLGYRLSKRVCKKNLPSAQHREMSMGKIVRNEPTRKNGMHTVSVCEINHRRKSELCRDILPCTQEDILCPLIYINVCACAHARKTHTSAHRDSLMPYIKKSPAEGTCPLFQNNTGFLKRQSRG
jgi:hypothetical protein